MSPECFVTPNSGRTTPLIHREFRVGGSLLVVNERMTTACTRAAQPVVARRLTVAVGRGAGSAPEALARAAVRADLPSCAVDDRLVFPNKGRRASSPCRETTPDSKPYSITPLGVERAALANEAYLKLVRSGGIRCDNKAHFLALCAQMIRRILVDHARQRGFAKRGGKALRVSLDDVVLAAEERGVELLALDRALDELARIDPRKSRAVELRYFGGLTIEETAAVLDVSIDTAKRDWRLTKAWLISQLTPSRTG